MAIATSLSWESMAQFDKGRFASFDIVEDSIYPGDTPLYEQRMLRDHPLAKARNNALLALRWKAKPPTPTQIRSRRHKTCCRRQIANFKLDWKVQFQS